MRLMAGVLGHEWQLHGKETRSSQVCLSGGFSEVRMAVLGR